jgi:hypothetical protein
MPEEERRRIEHDKCVFDVHMEEYGFHGKFYYTDGYLQEYIGGKSTEDANPFDIEMLLLSNICLDFNGEGRWPEERFHDLSIEFHDDLESALRKHRFGYDLNLPHTCYKCKHTTRVQLSVLDFLFEGRMKQVHGDPATSKR